MLIRFDGYKILLVAKQNAVCNPYWEAIVLEGLRPCAIARATDVLDAVANATILYHEVYLAGKEQVRRHYWLDKPNTDESIKLPDQN